MSASSPHAIPPGPRIVRHQPMVVVLAAVVAGIFLDRFCLLALWLWLCLAIAGLLVWATTFASHRRFWGGIAILAAVAGAAGAWHHCRWGLFTDNDLGRYAGRTPAPVCVEVVALGSPRRVPPPAPDPMRTMPPSEAVRLNVEAAAIRDGVAWKPVSGRATLLVQGKPPEIDAGDRLRCFARLSAVPKPLNPGEFDRSAYLRADRVLCRLTVGTPECVTVVEKGSRWNPSRSLDRLRAHGNAVLREYLDPRQAELASAVLLGLREELDSGRNEAFLTTGTIHILSISGLHVGILAGALFWVMRRTRLPRGLSAAAIATLTLLYAAMVDVGPPVVRATVLVLAACAAIYWRRQGLGFNSLAAAALVVLAINPSHLFQVGAQLSFLCLTVLIWCAARRPPADDEAERKVARTLHRLIEQNMSWWQRWLRKAGRSVVGLTLAGGAIWLVTTPLVMARFHIFSPVALVLNTLLWPFMTLGLLSGFGVLLFGTVCSPLAHGCAWLCNGSLWTLETAVNWAHRAPGGHFWMPGPPDWWLWVFYGGLGCLLAFPCLRPSRRWGAAMLAAWVAVGLVATRRSVDHDAVDCTFLAVGHGCAIVVELPTGETILYDAGQYGAPSAGVRAISGALWKKRIARLDAVVLSHPDIDHYNALPGLLDKFSVGAVYVSPRMFEKRGRAVADLRRSIDEYGVPVCEVARGDRISLGGDSCAIEVLHPSGQESSGPDNADSLVLSVAYRGETILLPGDLESPGLDVLLKQPPRRCAALLAPHHGSRKSNSPELARWCRPAWVVFSGDGRWSGADVDSPYRAVGAKVFHTYEDGAIRVRIDSAGASATPFVERPFTTSPHSGRPSGPRDPFR